MTGLPDDVAAASASGFAAFDGLDLPMAILNAIPAHVAVVDRLGVILVVNEAWRRFASANVLQSQDFLVGQNYLAVCERATGECSDEATDAAAGIRAVLEGRLPEFTLEYPCHSPTEVRWFRLMVTPLQERQQHGAVVMHLNITERKAAELRLRRSEANLAASQRMAHLGSWELELVDVGNLTEGALRWSAEVFRIWGYEPDGLEVTYDNFLRAVHPEDRGLIGDAVAAALRENRPYDLTHRIVRPDGTERVVREQAEFEFDPVTGQPTRMIGTVLDVTDQERAMHRLTEAQRIGRIGDWEWELASGEITWSPEVFEIVGRDPRAGPPRSFEEQMAVWDAPSQQIAQEYVERALTTGLAQEYELEAIRPDGQSVHVLARAVPRMDATGRVLGLYGTAQDISERKRAEMEAFRLASIVEFSDDAIISKTLDGVVTSWNRGAERIFGYTADEMIGTSITRLFPPARLEEEAEILAKVRRGESVEHFETSRVRKDGRPIDVAVAVSPMRDGRGAVVGASKVARDISDRKRLERQFLRAQRLESIGTLAGGIAHDLNNVLSPIMLSVELLRLDYPDASSQELLDAIDRSALHGANLVRQVLSFASGVEGDRLEVRVDQLVRDVERTARDTFLKHIDVRTSLPADLWRVVGDPTQLQQVLVNLCVNARDAMPTAGRLLIRAENVTLDANDSGLHLDATVGPYVLLRVEDSGSGIAPEDLERIFDPFFTTKEVGKGTGLGLSTSLAIVKSHGGFVRVYSEPGNGTKFNVYLPARTSFSDEEQARAVELPRGNGELVLVVDDEPSIRQITQKTLEAFGYRVVVATDGADALAIYARRGDDIAVVLTDMMMPVMDGAATIRVLRKLNPSVRIIAASGLVHNRSGMGVDLEIRHFLPKPYAADSLLMMLKDCLDDAP